jgi:DNA polymerase-3 subunit gamma/tau
MSAPAPVARSQPPSGTPPVTKTTAQNPQEQAKPLGTDAAPVDVTHLPWKDLLAHLNLKGRTAELAANCEIKAWHGDHLALVLSEKQASLYAPASEERLSEALSEYAGRPVKLKIEIGVPATETPAQSTARAAGERQQAAVKSIEEDSLVQALKEKFGAEVVTDSVRPNS